MWKDFKYNQDRESPVNIPGKKARIISLILTISGALLMGTKYYWLEPVVQLFYQSLGGSLSMIVSGFDKFPFLLMLSGSAIYVYARNKRKTT